MRSFPPPPRVRLEFPDFAGRVLDFAAPRETLVARVPDEVRPVLRAAEAHARGGRWVAGFVAYDAAPAFDPAFVVRGGTPGPLAWFGVFDAPADPEGAPDAASVGGDGAASDDAPARWTPDCSATEFERGVHEVREGIARGDWYQVNYTLRLHAALTGPRAAERLYARLRRAQPEAFAAHIDLGDLHVVSASPELFFRLAGRAIEMRPMKGTATRGRWAAEDDARARALASSPKERAENVMIVDLVRNDLGHVAVPGSVHVPELFAVERHPTVLQMTSTVRATLRDDVGIDDVFGALFPCGSITGAPKVAAMAEIARLEPSGRGPYCGAIGVLRPGGDAVFAVAIRTAWIDGGGHAVYGAGGGITWDSRPADEYAEALAKARVLTVERPDFSLLETLRLEEGVVVRQAAHLARLSGSAAWFGFADPTEAAQASLAALARARPSGSWRVRLLAGRDGAVSIQHVPFAREDGAPRRVALASDPVSSDDPFLFHKTTHRAAYDRRRAEHPDAFDVLLRNERGELTEFSIGNLVLELDGARVTPPRECGLLAGIFRAELLARGEVRERVLTVADLSRATRCWLVNSLREWVPVHVELPAPAVRG